MSTRRICRCQEGPGDGWPVGSPLEVGKRRLNWHTLDGFGGWFLCRQDLTTRLDITHIAASPAFFDSKENRNVFIV